MKAEELAVLEDVVKAVQSIDKRIEGIEKDIQSIYNKIDSINEDIYIDVKGFMFECNCSLNEIKRKLSTSGIFGTEPEKKIKLVSAKELVGEKVKECVYPDKVGCVGCEYSMNPDNTNDNSDPGCKLYLNKKEGD